MTLSKRVKPSVPLSEWLIDAPKPQEFFLDPFIPHDAFLLVSGQPKLSGKTMFLLRCCLSIATGKNMGPFKARQAPVLFVEEEGGADRMRQRILALANGANIQPHELQHLHWMFKAGIKLDKPSIKEALSLEVRRTEAQVVVMDPYIHLFTGDENKAADVVHVIDAARELRAQGVTVVILTHLRKGNREGPKSDVDEQVRGSSSLVGAYDQHLALRRYSTEEKSISLTVRSKDAEETNWQVGWKFKKTPDPGSIYLDITEEAEDDDVWEDDDDE